jgi:hypothetical protein
MPAAFLESVSSGSVPRGVAADCGVTDEEASVNGH